MHVTDDQGVLFSSEPYERTSPMSDYTNGTFLQETVERAIKTVAQTAVALIGAQAFDVLTFDWVALASVAAGAGVVSLLTSIGSGQVGDKDTPSLV